MEYSNLANSSDFHGQPLWDHSERGGGSPKEPEKTQEAMLSRKHIVL